MCFMFAMMQKPYDARPDDDGDDDDDEDDDDDGDDGDDADDSKTI